MLDFAFERDRFADAAWAIEQVEPIVDQFAEGIGVVRDIVSGSIAQVTIRLCPVWVTPPRAVAADRASNVAFVDSHGCSIPAGFCAARDKNLRVIALLGTDARGF